jgi:hypothetical protein
MPDTLTLCGGCGHPMHWKECGANPDSTGGPCRCDNSISVEVSPTMPDTPLDGGYQVLPQPPQAASRPLHLRPCVLIPPAGPR